MSRIGKQPINILNGVTVEISPNDVLVKGPKGQLSQAILEGTSLKLSDDNLLIVNRSSDSHLHKANHGLMRSLVNNMVQGVSTGFSKSLELNGVGFKVALQGKILKLNVGFSHDVNYNIPDNIEIKVEQNIITVSGHDKQQVGQVAAEIRSIKKPEPYKGKGIKYVGERIIRKSGKSGKDK
jgi:large subunit ribosomal protein L6